MHTESESTGDSCGIALASRTLTIASDGTVTAAGAAAAAAVSGGREAAHSQRCGDGDCATLNNTLAGEAHETSEQNVLNGMD